jgi:hypothetical protein
MRTYGPLFRFDPHTPPATDPGEDPEGRAVWYGGETFETAVREVLGRTTGHSAAPAIEACRASRLSAVRLATPTSLLDLTVHATRIGADDDIGDRTEDLDYERTRAWARALCAVPDYDGLRYHSARHRDSGGARVGINVALWRRGRPVEVVSDVPLSVPGAWRRVRTVLDRVGVAARLRPRCPRCSR